MSINTIVYGFPWNNTKIIEILKEENVITPKCWISRVARRKQNDKVLKEKSILYDGVFQSLKWVRKYADEVTKYTESVEFNSEVYNKVYEKLYVFIDQYSRHDFKWQQKGVHYYINQFNMLYHFFYGVFVKERIQLALFSDVPHFGVDWMIYEIAKALNIKTIVLMQSIIPNKFYYLDRIDDFGDFQFMTKQRDTQNIKLEKTFCPNASYVRLVDSFIRDKFSFWDVIKESIKRPHQLFEHFSYNYIRYLRAKRYRKNLSTMMSSVDYGKKYVYFPLHLQPEVTTSALGGMFCDQLLALELLSKKIPSDWLIYVKENPTQPEFMRNDAFFTRLKQIPNLQMTPLEESTFNLMEHSQFVATINGTAGWQAICGGKPALVFGQAWYQNFEGTFKWRDDIDIREIANYQIDHAKLENDYLQLVSKTATGVTVPEYIYLVEDYDEERNIQGIAGFLAQLIKEVNEEAVLYRPIQKKSA